MINKHSVVVDYLKLVKVKITSAVALTTITGYVLANGSFSNQLWLPVLGLFLVACGSAALNQYQERRLDALMERTKERPIPSGRISEFNALLFILIITTSGLLMILLSSNFIAMLLAFLALIWYNVVYTSLKRKSAFAVVPGSIIGALPPAIGWVAAGGSITDPQIIILSFFFFMWQIPHFWLLLMKYGYQYEKAGFPSLTKIYSETQLKHITFMWTLATALACLFIPFFRITHSFITEISLAVLAIGLIVIFSKLLFQTRKRLRLSNYFITINVFLLLVLISLSLDSSMP